MDHHSSGQLGCILAACRARPGADAANTSDNAKRAADRDGASEARRSRPFRYQFRLGDTEVDLLKALSLGSSYGVGSAWKMPLLENSRSASGVGNGSAEGRCTGGDGLPAPSKAAVTTVVLFRM
jgi:hypothetical protein